ncbi:hypothetical protein Focb16_v003137 [Fusarium oxysporum f. sp. cubense]|uniref:Uncharacterized protein n=1 Tax=Fusarium oxysporum f. sp. cubense TaxID=61366 RepID=A0A559L436_FUSOC|nr:hypothetical protein Focb16_v003137 [Fusarium oxysporum f. sp. cubense]
MVLSDLVLKWMLKNIQRVDTSNEVILTIDAKINDIISRLTSGHLSTGSGDIYDQILQYAPLGYVLSWTASQLHEMFPRISPFIDADRKAALWNGDRKIFHSKAAAYDYNRPLNQSGEMIGTLAKLCHRRYPSHTYEDFQLYRLHVNEIDEATYRCVISREDGTNDATLDTSLNHIVLDIHWQGPEYYNFYDKKLGDILTITKASPDGELYIERTVNDFLREFYGELGEQLFCWLGDLCTFKVRSIKASDTATGEVAAGTITIRPGQSYLVGSLQTSPPPRAHVLDKMHLHSDGSSLTAQFDDDSLSVHLPTNPPHLLKSALAWVVATFQTPNDRAEGLFRATCDTNEAQIGPPRLDPFSLGKTDSGCWTKLFKYAHIVE